VEIRTSKIRPVRAEFCRKWPARARFEPVFPGNSTPFFPVFSIWKSRAELVFSNSNFERVMEVGSCQLSVVSGQLPVVNCQWRIRRRREVSKQASDKQRRSFVVFRSPAREQVVVEVSTYVS